MSELNSNVGELRRLFDEAISASSIAEPLVSFDESHRVQDVLQFMTDADFDVVGVRHDGLPVGYVTRETLGPSSLADSVREFSFDLVVSEHDSLLRAFDVVVDKRFAFVAFLNSVGGIITPGDLQKPPVRMWLFNLVTLLEMHMLRLLRERYTQRDWETMISTDRFDAATRLLDDRRKRNEALDLADCLQFADKRCILLKRPALVTLFGCSKSDAESFLKSAESLRNELAHAQDIAAGRWRELADLGHRIESTLVALEDEQNSRSTA